MDLHRAMGVFAALLDTQIKCVAHFVAQMNIS